MRALAGALGPRVVGVALGYVDFAEELDAATLSQFETGLGELGFARIRSRQKVATEDLELALRALVQEHLALTATELREHLEPRLSLGYAEASALFREATQITPADRYNYLRLVRACELLREGELQVSEVGSLPGYNHLSSFSQAFKRATGVSPRAFIDGAVERLQYVG